MSVIRINETGEVQGDVLIRSTNDWVRLPPGVLGTVLTTQGVGSDPIWSAGGGGLSGTLNVTAGVNLAAGQAVVFDTTANTVILADPDAALVPIQWEVRGIATAAVLAGAATTIYSIEGQRVPVLFQVAPAAASNGSVVYLDTTAGFATLSVPPAGNAVVKLGTLTGADGVSVTPDVVIDFDVVAVI
jgi:hypothetical protein